MKQKLLNRMTGLGLRVLALSTLIIMIGSTASAEETPDISLTHADVTGVTSSTYAKGEIKNSGIEMYGYFSTPSNSTIGLSKNSNKTGGNWLAVKTNTAGKISKIIVKSAKTGSGKTTTLQVNKNNDAYNIDANTRLITSAKGTSAGSEDMVQNSAKDYEFSIGAEYFVIYNSTATGAIDFTGIDIYLDKTPVDPNQPAAPTFSVASGEVDANTTVTITGDEKTQSLKYWFDEETPTIVTETTATVTITKACTLHAIAIGEGDVESYEASATYTIAPQKLTYTKVNTLTSGKYVLICDGQIATPVNSETASTGRWNLADVTINNDKVTVPETYSFTITVDGTLETAQFQDSTNKYYGMGSNNTQFQLMDTQDATCNWTFTFEGDNVIFKNASKTTCVICHTTYANVSPQSNPTTCTYLVLYKLEEEVVAPAAPELDGVELTGNKITGSTLKFKSVEGVSVYYKITETVAESAPRRVIDAAAEGYTKYTEPVTLTTKMTGVSFFAQDDATGAQSDVVTYDIDLLSGIAGIEAEAGEAVYYNLQGVRVDNPVKGLYIRVANGKSSKVVR